MANEIERRAAGAERPYAGSAAEGAMAIDAIVGGAGLKSLERAVESLGVPRAKIEKAARMLLATLGRLDVTGRDGPRLALEVGHALASGGAAREKARAVFAAFGVHGLSGEAKRRAALGFAEALGRLGLEDLARQLRTQAAPELLYRSLERLTPEHAAALLWVHQGDPRAHSVFMQLYFNASIGEPWALLTKAELTKLVVHLHIKPVVEGEYGADPNDPEFGSFWGWLSKAASDVGKNAGKLIHKLAKTVEKPVEAVAGAVLTPVLGPAAPAMVKGALNLVEDATAGFDPKDHAKKAASLAQKMAASPWKPNMPYAKTVKVLLHDPASLEDVSLKTLSHYRWSHGGKADPTYSWVAEKAKQILAARKIRKIKRAAKKGNPEAKKAARAIAAAVALKRAKSPITHATTAADLEKAMHKAIEEAHAHPGPAPRTEPVVMHRLGDWTPKMPLSNEVALLERNAAALSESALGGLADYRWGGEAYSWVAAKARAEQQRRAAAGALQLARAERPHRSWFFQTGTGS